MSRIRIQTPSRLHFGLLAWGPQSPRQFGGVGLMVEARRSGPSAEPGRQWRTEGPLAGGALEVATGVAARMSAAGIDVEPLSPPDRAGAGRACRTRRGHPVEPGGDPGLFAVWKLADPSIEELSALTGRGQRSGISLHGFAHGGLIVDGGRHRPSQRLPSWRTLRFRATGRCLSFNPWAHRASTAATSSRVFAGLPPIADRVTERLCRLVLLGLLPAVQERDLESFGGALLPSSSSRSASALPGARGHLRPPRARGDRRRSPRRGSARGRAKLLGPDALRLQQPTARRAPKDCRTDPSPLRSSCRRPPLDGGESGGEPPGTGRLTESRRRLAATRLFPRSTLGPRHHRVWQLAPGHSLWPSRDQSARERRAKSLKIGNEKNPCRPARKPRG